MSKGFASIIILLGIAVIILIGGVVVYQKVLAPKANPTPTPIASPTPDPTANWKTYTNSILGYQVRYPSDWVIRDAAPDSGGGQPNKSSVFVDIIKNSEENNYPFGFLSIEGSLDVLANNVEKDINKAFENWIDPYANMQSRGYKKSVEIINSINLVIMEGIFSHESRPYYAKTYYLKTHDNKSAIVIYTRDYPEKKGSSFDQILSTFKYLN